MEKERDALGESQRRHEPVDLEDIVPGRGVRNRSGCGGTVRGRDAGGGVMRGEGDPQGRGHYVFLQRMDTQMMPAARKQADMTM